MDAGLAQDLRILALSVLYAIVGMGLLALAYKVFDIITPLHLGKVIFEDKNTAAAIAAGFFLLAVALIIAAAIHG